MACDAFGLYNVQTVAELSADQELEIARPRLAVFLSGQVQAARHFRDAIRGCGELCRGGGAAGC